MPWQAASTLNEEPTGRGRYDVTVEVESQNAQALKKSFRRKHQQRIRSWREESRAINGWQACFDQLVEGLPRAFFDDPISPADADLAINSGWHEQGVVMRFEEDPLMLFLRAIDTTKEAWTFVGYPVGSCPRCGLLAPLGPGVTEHEGLAEALYIGIPAPGHTDVCQKP